MKTTKYYCRDIFSLSNQEIVKLVDFIYNDINLDRMAEYLLEEQALVTRSYNYRKIEVCSSYYDWAYIVKVTYSFKGLSREVTTGFLLAMEGGPSDENLYDRDCYIQSVAGFYKPLEGLIWEKGVADDFGIEVDFSVCQNYIKKLHDFLNDTIKLWSDQLTSDKYEWNPQLKSMFGDNAVRNFIVEETQVAENLEN
ncbi:hypothetical protein [Pedobacter antarcticus]|uniref:hypothetical protein n=1 Tax=Pedobacter antarcticus TaxID=34086 RepID=UPI00087F1744|nr:hypothetical protein [Pedobacter antarcticus]SDM84778.1 hypothetical protein SAMN04488084_11577 [Pedobacter antarcticus]